MSAFVCSDEQVEACVRGWAEVAKWRQVTPEEQQRIANVLMRENIRSVNWRYGERTKIRKVIFGENYVHAHPHQLIQWLRCLDYQSCERDDYEKSEAYRLNLQMRVDMFDHVVNLKDGLSWAI